MTVLTLHNRVPHVGNGATVSFAYDYLVLASTHLEVYVSGILKILGTDYTVSGIGNPVGGLVTFTVAPANLAAILFLRVVPITQESAYPVGSKFPSKSHENSVDKLTMIAQQDKELALRTITLPPTEVVGGTSLVIPGTAAQRANKFLGFDATGNVIVTAVAPLAVSGHWVPIFSDQGVLATLTGTTTLTVVYTLPALALVRFPILLVFMRWNVETTSAVNHTLTNTILQVEGGQGFQNLVSSGTSPTSGGIITTFKLAYGAHVSCLAHGHGLATRSHGGVKQGTVGTFLGIAGAVGNWDAADVLPDLINPFNVARTNVCHIQMQNSRVDDTATLVSVEIYGCNAPNAA